MSLGFKLKYDEMKENDPTPEGVAPSRAFEEFYKEEGNIRNICFVQLDGKRMFLNYSYLVSGEYKPEANTIILTFTTHSVTLKGVNLDSLFYEIIDQSIRQITCVDERYNLIGRDEGFKANQIEIKEQ